MASVYPRAYSGSLEWTCKSTTSNAARNEVTYVSSSESNGQMPDCRLASSTSSCSCDGRARELNQAKQSSPNVQLEEAYGLAQPGVVETGGPRAKRPRWLHRLFQSGRHRFRRLLLHIYIDRLGSALRLYVAFSTLS